jgi:hypothetical protein
MCNNGCVLLSQKLSYRVQAFSIIRLYSLPTSSLISHKTESLLTDPSIKSSTRRNCVQCGGCSIFSVVNSPLALSRYVNRRAEVAGQQQHHLAMRCYGYEIRNTPRTNGIVLPIQRILALRLPIRAAAQTHSNQILPHVVNKSAESVVLAHLASAEPHGHVGRPQVTISHVNVGSIGRLAEVLDPSHMYAVKVCIQSP